MKVVVIGGKGHIGTYLVPRLVDAGHEVTVVTRGQREPYRPHPAWRVVQQVTIDRAQAEQAGNFGSQIAALEPEVVIDLISFTLASTRQLVEALRGRVRHFLHCGTAWVKGYVVEAPAREETPSPPFGEYGVNKAAIEDYLLREARAGNLPATMINPGHISGPGWPVINPLGNANPSVFSQLARGEPLYVPNFGMETLHHVHADDVAQVFMKALTHWSAAIGEPFFAVSPAAVTLKGYAHEAARWFGREADLRFVPWEEWKVRCGLTPQDMETSYDHLIRCQCYSTEKAHRLLDYQPRYTSFAAILEAVEWMVAQEMIQAR
jgi:nucleoside-diphosphate-sugar epimerase